MNGNNKSTASRLRNCITLVGKIFFSSKTDGQSSSSRPSSSEVNLQWDWLKNEYQKEYRILRRKARIHPEKAVMGALLVGFLLGFGTLNRVNRKRK
jgi:hypothetical protein